MTAAPQGIGAPPHGNCQLNAAYAQYAISLPLIMLLERERGEGGAGVKLACKDASFTDKRAGSKMGV